MTKLHSSTIPFLFLSCGLLACANTESGTNKPASTRAGASAVSETDAASERDDEAKGSKGDEKPDAGAQGQVPEMAEATEPGTFSHIYEQAFKSCRTGCHGMGYSMLNMATRDLAYASLVDHDSNPGNKECAKLMLKRVKPGAPDVSLLYLKLDIHAPCGQQMPPGGTLKQEVRDEVRDWIANGAKDD